MTAVRTTTAQMTTAKVMGLLHRGQAHIMTNTFIYQLGETEEEWKRGELKQ
jgi:hypothetical protein